MTFQSLDPELTAKVIFLANLQRNLMQNPTIINEKSVDTIHGQQQQQLTHPLLMPSLNVPSQKISAMLTALSPSSVSNPIQSRSNNSSVNIRPNGSSFGWGNRERKMEENWRMQNRHL